MTLFKSKSFSKDRHIMKTKMKPSFGKTCLISRSVLSALALIGAAQAAANAQFAHVPPYLQKESKSSAVKVKPNVMMLIDDSGSMTAHVPGTNGETRLKVTKDVLHAVLDRYGDKINWGFQTLNNNKNANFEGYTSNHRLIKGKVDTLEAYSATPTTRRYYEVSKYVRDETKYRCQKNYIVLMSDGEANFGCDWSNRANRPADMRNHDWNFDFLGIKPFVYESTVSPDDRGYFGAPPANRAGFCRVGKEYGNGPYDTFFDRNHGLRFFSEPLLKKDFKTSGKDAAGKSWNGDAADPKDASGKSIYEKQTVETFTVALGLADSLEGTEYLKQGAAVSGGVGFFPATSKQDLVDAFGTIFSNIDASNAPVAVSETGNAAPAVSGPGRTTDVGIVDVHSGSWSSRLKFYGVRYKEDSQGRRYAEVDKNTFAEPSFDGRRVMLNNGSKTHWLPNLTAQDTDNAYFALSAANPSDQLEWKEALLPWVSRSKGDNDVRQLADTRRYSQKYRIRPDTPVGEKDFQGSRHLGDILDSPLITAGSQVNGRAEFMVTAANDGMVHLFQSQAGANPYALKLSYIPAAMERDDDAGRATTMAKYLKDVAHENYGQGMPHRYMVNGGIVVRRTADSDATKGQQIFMFGAMGQGGRGAYALNIGGQNRETGAAIGLNAADSNWLNQVPLFETAKGAGNTLGYTVGTPQIGRVSINRTQGEAVSTEKDVRYAGFLASGYRVKGTVEGKANETALYVYDMLGQNAHSGKEEGAAKGTLIRKINVENGVGGLSSPTLVDTDFDGIIDIAYAGDYGGNMYRFDLRGKTNEWKAERIYAGMATQPITAAPAVSRRSNNKYVVIFGTGSDIYQDDVKNTDQQAMYGIFDNLTEAASAAGSLDLLEQKLVKADVADQTAYTLSNNKITPSHKGWKINLPEIGERVVVKPTMILRTAVFSTRSYQEKETKTNPGGADVCIPEVTTKGVSGSTMLLGVDAETGAMPKEKDARVEFFDKQPNSDLPYYTGVRREGIVSFTFLDGGKKSDSAVTADGDSGGSGTDEALKSAGQVPQNRCFATSEVRTLFTNKGEPLKVSGRICALKRISWRELFW